MNTPPNINPILCDIGTIKKINKNKWIIIKHNNKNKWILLNKHNKYKSKYINDNGFFSFLLYYNYNNDAYIYKKDKYNLYNNFVYYINNIHHIWIGKHKYYYNFLISYDNKYIFIGQDIYTFPNNDNIIKFYSYIDNNNISYPIAISDNFVYLFLYKIYFKKILLPNINKSSILNIYNFYTKFINNDNIFTIPYNIIHERIL